MLKVNNNLSQIRIVGDKVLHAPGQAFPAHPTSSDLAELQNQIAIAKKLLIETGGAGIAANQCLAIQKPYQFAIVGVFYEHHEHVERLNERYPNTIFPAAVIMINPQVIHSSSEMQCFKHGCLSIPGNLRGEIATPREIEVEFQIFDHDMLKTKKQIYRNADAVVLQHELNHIIHGKTYIDCCFEHLSADSLALFKEALENEQNDRRSRPADFTRDKSFAGFFHFASINDLGSTELNLCELTRALQTSIADDLLAGLKNNLEMAIADRICKSASLR